uniref:Uncharacterized protein n=1 Tax=Populus trichocarpa TaxID=3694 RepID=A0A2K1YNH6_POPTR
MPRSSWLCCSQCSSLHVLLSPERENTHETHAGEFDGFGHISASSCEGQAIQEHAYQMRSASQSNSIKTDLSGPIYHTPSLLISMLQIMPWF